jgi:WD40 repeat protein
MNEIRATGETQTHAPVIRGDGAPQLIGQKVGEAKFLRTLEGGHASWVNAVAVTPDGRAVSASHDATLKVWELESGATIATFSGDASAQCFAPWRMTGPSLRVTQAAASTSWHPSGRQRCRARSAR